MVAKKGLYANIAAKKARIAAGSGEKMRKVGTKGAPTAKAFKQSAKTIQRKPFIRRSVDTCQLPETKSLSSLQY